MACAAPIVATDVGGVREYLGDGGVATGPGNPTAMADAITSILTDTTLASNLGNAGRRRAEEFDYGIVARMHADAYRAVAALPRRGAP